MRSCDEIISVWSVVFFILINNVASCCDCLEAPELLLTGTVPTNNQHCGARAGARDGRGGLCQVPYLLIINTGERAGARDGRGGLCQVLLEYLHRGFAQY